MHKKLILGLVTFAMAVIAYWVLSSADNRRQARPNIGSAGAVRDFIATPTTQSSQSINEAGMTLRPGTGTLARVYDDITGRLKYQFEAQTWEPVSDTDFLLQNLLIQIFSPKGEVTYISADRAQVTLARKSKNRLEPKHGWMRENVKVIIDRTTAEWREANPDLAPRDAHRDDLINIDLQEARFDLDQAELVADGAIVVDSREARMENLDSLRLQWNQLDNRIDVLTFKHGGRMLLRRGGRMVDFGLPGAERDAKGPEDAGTGAMGPPVPDPVDRGAPEAAGRFQAHRAEAMKPMTVSAPTADEAAAEVRAEGGVVTANRPKSLTTAAPPAGGAGGPSVPGQLRSPEALATDVETLRAEARAARSDAAASQPAETPAGVAGVKRVHTYAAVFQNHVVVEQLDAGKTIGKLEADKLELNFDFGPKLKDLTRSPSQAKLPDSSAAPATQPAGDRPAAEPPPPNPLENDTAQLILTWDGPLEMRPMRVDPGEQTGQRFDAIATGNPVRVESQLRAPAPAEPDDPAAPAKRVGQQGSARCNQLVYRHERRQVWLSGTEQEPVEMTVNESRKLSCREVFFDKSRGLARVDGAGRMQDDRRDEVPAAQDGTAANAGGAPKLADPAAQSRKDRAVEIRWSRGVDIEMGLRSVQRMNPATGVMEEKRREFLQRAWFHGDAFIKRGDSQLSADEVAATFGPPMSGENLADNIQHLDLSGRVKLSSDKDLISAERLDVEMTITPDGRNSPRIVDGEGGVLVRQGKSEFRASRMHAVLQPRAPDQQKKGAAETATSFSSSRMGIASLEAHGNVFASDPDHNLKIRRTETLTCTMHPGDQLSKATLVSRDPAVYARLRYGEMAIHGHRIEIDMDSESVDVPGPGKSWMVSHNDFGGRKLKKPAPVKTTWEEKMQFRLAKEYGLFIGHVHSETQSFSLDSDKLTVRFGKAPPVQEQQKDGKLVNRFWILGAITGEKAELKPIESTMPGQERSRPVAVIADGNAEALSSTYAPAASEDTPGRLVSRLRIAGDRVVADLQREQMSVPGAGSLLIEDYQFEPKDGPVRLASAAQRTAPLMSSLREDGPSQTLVTWENSMDYFLDRNLVAFDKNVSMIHRSGQQVVLQDELAKTMHVDPEALKKLREGRKASLECGNLLLEFMTGGSTKDEAGAGPLVRATDLQRLIAKYAVRLQDGTKSLMGAHLQYLHEINEVRLEGSQNIEARIFDEDEATQRFNMWRGPLLIWNLQTNRIEAPGATIRASRD